MKETKSEILLESGTNEIEIMQFTIYGELYGINVAKVKEIMMSDKVKPMPHVHPAVEGIYKPRGTMVTVIDLPFYLTGKPTEKQGRDLFIVTNFNKMFIAFRVHSVVEISRISWSDIRKPDSSITQGEDGVATGIAQCGDQLVTILDFEKIVAEIAPETSIQMSEIEKLGHRDNRADVSIVMAEDSVLLARMIETALKKAGYINVRMFNNGEETWHYLRSIKHDSDLDEKVNLIITDIEMPKMDGHRLTKLVKEDPDLKHIPLIIFSSLISPEMEIKGKELGADEQLTKPEIGHLVAVIDHLIEKYKNKK